MSKQFESFVLGGGKVPVWYNQEANAGKVKQIFNEDGEVVETHIASGTKVYVAHDGDTIINTNYGLVVLKQQDAKKFGVQKKDGGPARDEKPERPYQKKKYEEKKANDKRVQ